jgi:DNA-binding transcriptional regulator YdaS (Cro superfamily)
MTMRDYLFKHDLPVKKFAADLGISASYLYQLLRKERKPSLELALKIERYTQGKVSVDELRKEGVEVRSSDSLSVFQKVVENKLKEIEFFLEVLDERVRILEETIELHSV